MLSQNSTNSGNSVIRALQSARRSWWRRALADAGLFAILVASGAVAAGWLRSWLSGEGVGRLGPQGLLSQVLIAAAGGLLIWLVASAARSPSLLDIARRVDRLLGQSESFSTSYEVLTSGARANVVTRSLLADVEERTARLPVSSTGWRRGGNKLTWIAAGSAVIAATLLFAPIPARRVPVAARPPVADRLTAQERAEEAATLAGVAQLLDLVAEQEDSDYLRAVGNSFSDLAARVGSGEVGGNESERLAQELTQHLQAASQEVGGRFADAVSEAFAGPAVSPDSGAGSPASAEQVSTSAEGEPVMGDATPQAPVEAAGADLNSSYYESLNALMDQFEADPAAVGVRPERSSARYSSDGDGFYGGVLNAETDPNAVAPQQAALGRSEGQAGGAAVGAAERSSDAAGDAAGQGGAEFGVGSASFLDLAVEGGEMSALQRNESDDGKFVEMELVPRADDAVASSGAAQTMVPAFSRADESAFTTRGIGAEHADVVSRYFTPGFTPPTFTPSTVPPGARP